MFTHIKKWPPQSSRHLDVCPCRVITAVFDRTPYAVYHLPVADLLCDWRWDPLCCSYCCPVAGSCPSLFDPVDCRYVEVCFLYAHFVERCFVFFYQKYWILSKKPFLHLLRWSYGFHSLICWCGVSHWFICTYRNFLHPWDKSHLIMVYDPFNILLNLVCWYVVEDFCVCVVSDIGPQFSFLWYFCLVLVSGRCWLCRKGSKGFLSLPFLWKSLRRIDVNSSLNVLQNWPVCMFFHLSESPSILLNPETCVFHLVWKIFHQYFLKYCLHSVFPLSVWVSKTHA